jgi:hypothetical protein
MQAPDFADPAEVHLQAWLDVDGAARSKSSEETAIRLNRRLQAEQ